MREELIETRIEVEAEVGRGPLARVFRARRGGPLRAPVALAMLHPELAHAEGFLGVIRDAAACLGECPHPHVLGTFEEIETEKHHYLALEWVPGASLRRWLAERNEPLPWPRAAAIAVEVLSALEAAHERGLSHGGLTDGAIRLRRDGRVKVGRFGAVRALETLGATRVELEGQRLSHPAPERLEGAAPSFAGDIFGVGTLLFALLDGRSPFDAATASARDANVRAGQPALDRDDLPALLREAVAQAMADSPDERFDSARSFRHALVRLLRTVDDDTHPSALAPSIAAAMRDTTRPVGAKGLPTTSTMHVELDELKELRKREPEAETEARPQATRRLRPPTADAPPPLPKRESPSGQRLLRPPIGVADQVTEHLDIEELERLIIEEGKPLAPHQTAKLAEPELRRLVLRGNFGLTPEETAAIDLVRLRDLVHRGPKR